MLLTCWAVLWKSTVTMFRSKEKKSRLRRVAGEVPCDVHLADQWQELQMQSVSEFNPSSPWQWAFSQFLLKSRKYQTLKSPRLFSHEHYAPCTVRLFFGRGRTWLCHWYSSTSHPDAGWIKMNTAFNALWAPERVWDVPRGQGNWMEKARFSEGHEQTDAEIRRQRTRPGSRKKGQ